MYHSRTFWFQILRYNSDHTLLFLYACIACTSIVPWRGCHCSIDICKKSLIELPFSLVTCQLPMHEPIHMWPFYSSTWLQESLFMSSEHSACPSRSLRIVTWLCQSSDFLISNVHLTLPGLPHFHVKLGVNLPVSLSQAARIRAGSTHWALRTSLLSLPPQSASLLSLCSFLSRSKGSKTLQCLGFAVLINLSSQRCHRCNYLLCIIKPKVSLSYSDFSGEL